MNDIIKVNTYEVIYLYGVLDPTEYKIKIESSVSLTEDYIKSEIIKKRKLDSKCVSQITHIISCLIVDTKEFDNQPIKIAKYGGQF